MEGKSPASNRSYVEKEGGEEAADNQLSVETVFGNLIWVKLHESSWWPAQVVDENNVSGSNKPNNRSVGEVLVRLYGSYKYLYVNPIKCHSEFENILKENNGSHGEILKKALEQDLPRPKSGRSKRQGSKFKENAEAAKSGREKLDRANKKLKTDHPSPVRFSPRRPPAGSSPQTRVKNGNLLSENAKGAKSKNGKEDCLQKKQVGSPSLKLKPSPSSPQTSVKNGNLLSEKTKEELKTKGQNHNGVQKTPKPSNPRNSPATKSVRKSKELIARKTKVMQSLGLVAPSGSPFHRNGCISQSPVPCD